MASETGSATQESEEFVRSFDSGVVSLACVASEGGGVRPQGCRSPAGFSKMGGRGHPFKLEGNDRRILD